MNFESITCISKQFSHKFTHSFLVIPTHWSRWLTYQRESSIFVAGPKAGEGLRELYSWQGRHLASWLNHYLFSYGVHTTQSYITDLSVQGFGIREGSWNQFPMDTKGWLYRHHHFLVLRTSTDSSHRRAQLVTSQYSSLHQLQSLWRNL